MSEVVKLAISNDRPRRNACTDCRHFHPNTSDFGTQGWELFGFGPGVKPSAQAIHFARCSATGGGFAVNVRGKECHGDLFDPA